MKILLFIPSTSVKKNKPGPWFKQILDEVIKYYQKNKSNNLVFLISGRWNNTQDKYEFSEAEVAKNYIKVHLPKAEILVEEIAVETGGNFAFSKPFIEKIKPDKVVIFSSLVKENRIKYLAHKIYGSQYPLEFVFVSDSFSDNPRAVAKEPKALAMFKKLLDNLQDGDDRGAREILMYKTPFYFYDIMNNSVFFDKYWPGGHNDFQEKRLSINNK